MSRRDRVLLLLLGLAVAGLTSLWIVVPGYMDADYYYATALQLVKGHGLTEPFLWNYLDQPTGLPHPSHLYWMPLVTFVASASLRVLGDTFAAARLPFVLAAASLPLLTAKVSLMLTGDRGHARFSGALAAFPGFFLPFLLTTDSFSLFALVGSGALVGSALARRSQRASAWAGVGLLIGLAHLTRVDGILLLFPALLAIGSERSDVRGRALLALGAGYVLVIAPWLARTYAVTGSLSSPATSRVLWLLHYDELFIYPASQLNPGRWAGAGWGAILGSRVEAFGSNLQSLVAVNGLVFLAPLIVLGGLRLRKQALVRLSAAYLALLLLVMSFAFPFAGARGGYFHSSVALMPVCWALATVGLATAVEWGARRRGWVQAEALRAFRLGALGLAAALTLGLFVLRVGPVVPASSAWGASQRVYAEAGEFLQARNPGMPVVAVNNPPGFYLATGLPCVVIPDGTPETLRQVVDRFGASWVVLERNHPLGLQGLYEAPNSLAWLSLRGEIDGLDGAPAYLLEVVGPQAGR